MSRVILLLVCLLALVAPARAERLVSQVSNETIEITSSFAGERMNFFGTIIPDAGSEQKYVEGPFHVIVVVLGPTQNRVARQKTNVLGVWLNTDQVEFDNFPSYFHVLSSGRLTDITDVTTLTTNLILPESHTLAANSSDWWKGAVFGRQLIPRRNRQGVFIEPQQPAVRPEPLKDQPAVPAAAEGPIQVAAIRPHG